MRISYDDLHLFGQRATDARDEQGRHFDDRRRPFRLAWGGWLGAPSFLKGGYGDVLKKSIELFFFDHYLAAPLSSFFFCSCFCART